MKKIKVTYVNYKLLLIIGIIPFAIPLVTAINGSIVGTRFMFSTTYGIDAFITCIIVYSILFWPTYIFGLLLIVISIKKIKKTKQEKLKGE